MRKDHSSSRTPVPAFPDVPEGLRAFAHRRFPGGVTVVDDHRPEHQVEATRRFLDKGETIIYGAAFTANGVLAIVDVLLQRKGRWYAYLVRPSTRIKENHLMDAALHEQVLQQAGLDVGEVVILLLNMQYVRQGELSPRDLFVEQAVGRKLARYRHTVHGRMQMVKRIAAKRSQKEGSHGPAYSRQGEGHTPLGEAGSIEVEQVQLRGFLATLQYPLYFMDFEAYQSAVPEYDGHWPFRQIPFQYSVHRRDHPGGSLVHESFIAPVDREPTAAFTEALLHVTGEAGTVLVYNIDSEQLMLHQLAEQFPLWNGRVQALRARLVDLMTPLTQKWIRIPAIGNKLSLKYVLPALVPDMSYDSLAIANGDIVNQAYNALRTSTDPAFIEETHAALLAYCEVDTLAMVKILDRMEELAG